MTPKQVGILAEPLYLDFEAGLPGSIMFNLGGPVRDKRLRTPVEVSRQFGNDFVKVCGLPLKLFLSLAAALKYFLGLANLASDSLLLNQELGLRPGWTMLLKAEVAHPRFGPRLIDIIAAARANDEVKVHKPFVSNNGACQSGGLAGQLPK